VRTHYQLEADLFRYTDHIQFRQERLRTAQKLPETEVDRLHVQIRDLQARLKITKEDLDTLPEDLKVLAVRQPIADPFEEAYKKQRARAPESLPSMSEVGAGCGRVTRMPEASKHKQNSGGSSSRGRRQRAS